MRQQQGARVSPMGWLCLTLLHTAAGAGSHPRRSGRRKPGRSNSHRLLPRALLRLLLNDMGQPVGHLGSRGPAGSQRAQPGLSSLPAGAPHPTASANQACEQQAKLGQAAADVEAAAAAAAAAHLWRGSWWQQSHTRRRRSAGMVAGSRRRRLVCSSSSLRPTTWKGAMPVKGPSPLHIQYTMMPSA